MKKIGMLILLEMFYLRVNAQFNLVPNPSFEDTVECPHFASQIDRATGWHASSWTPDYFNECDWLNGNTAIPGNFCGFQYAQDGMAYAGIVTYATNGPNFTEAFTCQLISPLIIGEKYLISFYASEGDLFYRLSANKLGALFSTFNFDTSSVPPMNNYCQFYSDSIITDTLHWILLQGSFIADSNYAYMTIGRFFDDLNTDTISTPPFYVYSYYYIDNITVIKDTTSSILENHKDTVLTFYPNPASEKLIIRDKSNLLERIEIINISNQVRLLMQNPKKRKEIEINISCLNTGVYFIRFFLINGTIKNHKLIKQ